MFESSRGDALISVHLSVIMSIPQRLERKGAGTFDMGVECTRGDRLVINWKPQAPYTQMHPTSAILRGIIGVIAGVFMGASDQD